MLGKKSALLFLAALGLLLGLLSITTPAFAASKEKVLYSFCSTQLCPDGSNPAASLISDAAGNLYGTAVYGGNSNCPHGCGVVFELTPANGRWKQKVLHHFEDNGRDGYYPEGSLIFDKAGNLYGTTSVGGTYSGGTVFELMLQEDGKWKEKILHSLKYPGDGSAPRAALTLDASGNLYGTASYGGSYDCGLVFKLTRGANGQWSEKVLYDFVDYEGSDGCYPAAVLVFDSSGNLYGATGVGGQTGNGTIFELTPGKHGSWTEKVLYFFGGGSDGGVPGDVVFDKAGSLYGVTGFGGGYPQSCMGGCGTVFKFTPGAKGQWTLTTLFSFDQTDGAFPGGRVIFDAAGNLYSTTQGGGAYGSDCPSDGLLGCGTVFKLTPGGDGKWTEEVLHSFDNNGVDGWEPYSGLIMDAAGNLYGITFMGGAYNYGTVFEITL